MLGEPSLLHEAARHPWHHRLLFLLQLPPIAVLPLALLFLLTVLVDWSGRACFGSVNTTAACSCSAVVTYRIVPDLVVALILLMWAAWLLFRARPLVRQSTGRLGVLSLGAFLMLCAFIGGMLLLVTDDHATACGILPGAGDGSRVWRAAGAALVTVASAFMLILAAVFLVQNRHLIGGIN
jgi:hypothetical protein